MHHVREDDYQKCELVSVAEKDSQLTSISRDFSGAHPVDHRAVVVQVGEEVVDGTGTTS